MLLMCLTAQQRTCKRKYCFAQPSQTLGIPTQQMQAGAERDGCWYSGAVRFHGLGHTRTLCGLEVPSAPAGFLQWGTLALIGKAIISTRSSLFFTRTWAPYQCYVTEEGDSPSPPPPATIHGNTGNHTPLIHQLLIHNGMLEDPVL